MAHVTPYRNPYHLRMLAIEAGLRLVKRGLTLYAYKGNSVRGTAPLSLANAANFMQYEEQRVAA